MIWTSLKGILSMKGRKCARRKGFITVEKRMKTQVGSKLPLKLSSSTGGIKRTWRIATLPNS